MKNKTSIKKSLKQLIEHKWVFVFFASLLIVIGFQSYLILDLKNTLEKANVSESQNTEPTTVTAQNVPNSHTPTTPSQGNSIFDNFWDSHSWDSFAEIERMQEQMDALFGQSFGQLNNGANFQNWLMPSSEGMHIDVNENRDQYVITVEIPGADQSSININLTEQELTISGTRVEGEEEDSNSGSGSFFRREQRSIKLSRTITLDQPVKPERMITENKGDTLIIKLPKDERFSG